MPKWAVPVVTCLTGALVGWVVTSLSEWKSVVQTTDGQFYPAGGITANFGSLLSEKSNVTFQRYHPDTRHGTGAGMSSQFQHKHIG
jgi:hypothetical protein